MQVRHQLPWNSSFNLRFDCPVNNIVVMSDHFPKRWQREWQDRINKGKDSHGRKKPTDPALAVSTTDRCSSIGHPSTRSYPIPLPDPVAPQTKFNLDVIIIKLTFAMRTGHDSSVGRVSAPGNGRSRVRSRAATYQSRKKMVLAAPRLALRLTG